MIQEAFAEFDVPWRNQLVRGWNPVKNGEFALSDVPGLGLELDEAAIAEHPYVKHAFPSLWDDAWVTNFTQTERH
jgi:galactonate dehydratase